MKRLIKESVMSQEMFESNLKQLSEKGREILRSIEDYKFTIEQAARVFTNDQQLTQKLIQKRKTMDAAAGQIYSVVFDIENIDIVSAYESQVAQSTQQPSAPPLGGAAHPPVSPPQQNTPPPQPPQEQDEASDDDEEESDEDETEEDEKVPEM